MPHTPADMFHQPVSALQLVLASMAHIRVLDVFSGTGSVSKLAQIAHQMIKHAATGQPFSAVTTTGAMCKTSCCKSVNHACRTCP